MELQEYLDKKYTSDTPIYIIVFSLLSICVFEINWSESAFKWILFPAVLEYNVKFFPEPSTPRVVIPDITTLDLTFINVPSIVAPAPVILKLALLRFVFAPDIVTFEVIAVLVPAIVEFDATLKTAESISTFAVAVSVIRSSEASSNSPSTGELISKVASLNVNDLSVPIEILSDATTFPVAVTVPATSTFPVTTISSI